MDSSPSAQNTNTNQAPQAEVLKPRTEDNSPAQPINSPPQAATGKKPRRHTYRPSHKATFIGIAVVLAILAVNAAVIMVVLKKQAKNDSLASKGQVSISAAQLSKLGIDRNNVGDSGVQLIVAPDAQFNGKMSVAGATTLSGQLILNSNLTGTNASLTQLQAGNTSLGQLNVNGNTSLSALALRSNLSVVGSSQLQGPVTVSQLLTINNNANITGNLSIGGVLTVNKFNIQSLVVGGHLISSGPAPGVGPGSALGSNGTTSISGNDASGSIAINIGTGAGGGTLANVAFHDQYANTPRVVITPVGVGANFYITNLSIGGFSVGVTAGLPPGGYHIEYIVEQ